MFGKRVSEYLQFQRFPLLFVAVVGLGRLTLSLAGLPDSIVQYLSISVAGWAVIFYYGVAVHTQGFGSYKQLLPLMLFQVLLVQAIAVSGILLAIAGWPNIYAAPEYSGPPFARSANQWTHLLGHLTIGIVAPVLLWWAFASLTMRLARRATKK